MKNYFLSLGLVLSFIAPSLGQMTLVNTFVSNQNYDIQVVNLSISGEKFAVVRYQMGTAGADTIYYYNMDYSLWKTIPCPSIANYGGYFAFHIFDYGNSLTMPSLYSSETLFNNDSLLEVAVEYQSIPGTICKLMIINEKGVFVDSILDLITFSGPFQVHKLSTGNFIATVRTTHGPRVYSLPGTLPCEICGGGLGVAKMEEKPTNILSSPVPNPSKNEVKITFTLPEGANRGELTIYDTQGKKMKSYTVDNRFGFIIVDDSQFAPGMYYYNLTVNGVVSSSQKMVVIK